MDIFRAIKQFNLKGSTIDLPYGAPMMPNFTLLQINPCPNCKENLWQHDDELWLNTRGKMHRFGCWNCGDDFHAGRMPGNILRDVAEEIV